MNYRHKHLRLIQKQQEAKWDLERQNLQQDIKLLEQAQKKSEELSKLLDDTVNILGKEEVKNLGDIRNLLQGKTLKELVENKQLLSQKITDQDKALLNLARSKIKGKKEAEQLLNDLETNFSQQKIAWETEKEKQTQELAKAREIIAGKDKELKSQQEQIKSLSSNNDKLSKEKDRVILEKNTLNETILTLTNDKKILVKQSEEHQEQLRKINLLFDENAKDYSVIDFNGLYKLLETVKAERERERERKKWW